MFPHEIHGKKEEITKNDYLKELQTRKARMPHGKYYYGVRFKSFPPAFSDLQVGFWNIIFTSRHSRAYLLLHTAWDRSDILVFLA